MKKLQAILKGRIFADMMFELREKQVKTALTVAKNDIEEQEAEATIKYEELCKKLGDKEVDYKSTFNEMLKCKENIRKSQETRIELKEIEDDLNSDVQLDKEDSINGE